MTGQHDDPPGTRSIRLEVEVPGTPEQVWEAIASGPGITAWFVPAEVTPQEGGAMTLEFGPGMLETCEVVAYDAPRRFVYATPGERGRGLAYEWVVEAKSGGTCVVRLVNSGFGLGDDWDAEYDGMESGWRLFLDNLRLYLTHFRGERCSALIVNGSGGGGRDAVWSALVGALGLPVAPAVGERVATDGDGVPQLAGVVERVAAGMLTLRVDAPAAGNVFLAAEGGGERISTSVYAYLFGPDAAAVTARERPRWEAWMAQRFPLTT